MAISLPEVWLRGPWPGVPPQLQPVAHALIQAREEIEEAMKIFPNELLWHRPADVASVGFHLQHLTGVLDRLFTYARGESLTTEQLAYLAAEGKETTIRTQDLVAAFADQVERSVAYLKQVDETLLTEYRKVGRAGLPSTVMGLLFHGAEHTMRHLGQLLVTAKVVQHS